MRGLFRGWLIVGLAFMVMVLVFGSRFTLGLFLPGLTESLGASLSSVSLVFAFATLLSGISQPLIGSLADRFGPAVVIQVGLVAMGLAYVGTGFAVSLWQVMLLMGLVSGIAFSAVNLVILSALISRWFQRYRGRALGLVTSGSKIGTLVVLPATGAAIAIVGWRASMVMLGISMLILVPFLWRYLRSNPQDVGLNPDGRPAPDAATASDAGRQRETSSGANSGGTPSAAAGGRVASTRAALLADPVFWLLTMSLFSNGFMMNLVYLHLPSFIIQQGHTPLLATGVMALMGGIGIVGNILSGMLSDWISRKLVLAVLYFSRAVATLLILHQPELWMIYAFAVVFGFLGYGAVALTSNITSDIFGAYSLGTVFGLIYVLHQVGGALGTYAGGLSVDLTGSYTLAFGLCAAISGISTVLVLLVPDRKPLPSVS